MRSMKAEVWVYETKKSYALNEPSHGEEYYSITEAIAEKRKLISQVKREVAEGHSAFLGFRIYDSVGNLKWELPSESVPDWYVEEMKAQRRAEKSPELQEYRKIIRTYQE
jgi:hypothetical protein